MKILIISAIPDDLETILRTLFNGSLESVTIIASFDAAISQATNFDLIILDLWLEDSKVLDTIARFPFQRVPTIAITGAAGRKPGEKYANLGIRCIDAGAEYFFRKPISLEMLEWAVPKAIENFQMKVDIQQLNATHANLQEALRQLEGVTHGVSG